GGAGYFPVAPGTVGSLEGIALVLLLQLLPVGQSLALGAAVATVFAVGVWSAGRAAIFFGGKDPGRVVIDEVAGQMLTFAARPRDCGVGWKWLVAGFALFRALDILKPFPADAAEKLPG